MLAIVDYAAGNQTSVARALRHLDIPCVITDKPEIMTAADGIIFPGVGAAGQAMAHLRATGLDKGLADAVARNQPLLGICLGCQILLDQSEEDNTPTLGILPGQTRRFVASLRQEDGSPAPVPHMGWNSIRKLKHSPLLEGLPDGAEFYFVHSYYVEPPQELMLATTTYGREFCSIYGRDGLWAVQFHAEKSGPHGLRLLQNFHHYCQGRRKCCPNA